MGINKEELRVFDATMWQMARGEFEIIYRFDLNDFNIYTQTHIHTHMYTYYKNNTYYISLYFIFDSIINFTFCILINNSTCSLSVQLPRTLWMCVLVCVCVYNNGMSEGAWQREQQQLQQAYACSLLYPYQLQC